MLTSAAVYADISRPKGVVMVVASPRLVSSSALSTKGSNL